MGFVDGIETDFSVPTGFSVLTGFSVTTGFSRINLAITVDG